MPMIEAEMRGTAIVAPLPAPRRFMPASTDPASGTATGIALSNGCGAKVVL